MTIVIPDAAVPITLPDGRVSHHWYSLLKLWVDAFNTTKNLADGGAAKAWGLVTVSGGAPTLAADYNIESITDDGTGTFSPVFTGAMANATYAVVCTIHAATGSRSLTAQVTSKSTTGCTIAILQEGATAGSAAAVIDDISFSFAVFGDLA